MPRLPKVQSKKKGGHPPGHTRFKPGQSGNPSGRPKGSTNLQIILERELRKFVSITENGRTRRMTKQEVMVRRLVHDAIKGEYRAVDLLLKLARPALNHEGEHVSETFAMPSKEALKTIARRLKKTISEIES